jgi:hypothetical protein
VRVLFLASAAVALAALAACDNPNDFLLDPQLVTDTVTLAAPSVESDLPSALDLTSVGGARHGGRYPERLEDAGQWDLVLRLTHGTGDGALVLAPAGAVGAVRSNAAITRPLQGRTFSEVVEAPGRSSFLGDTTISVTAGAVYVARSRAVQCGISFGELYAKLRVLEAVPAEGSVRLEVVANLNCSDPRLAERG